MGFPARYPTALAGFTRHVRNKRSRIMKYHSLIPANNGANKPPTNPCQLLDFEFSRLETAEKNIAVRAGTAKCWQYLWEERRASRSAENASRKSADARMSSAGNHIPFTSRPRPSSASRQRAPWRSPPQRSQRPGGRAVLDRARESCQRDLGSCQFQAVLSPDPDHWHHSPNCLHGA